jgi:uridine phosphorylase
MSAESAAELIVTPTNKVYHLHLDGADIADTVLLVGDPDRVELISKRFDSITTTIRNREFVTVTGTYKNKALTVLSTGIGPDNIDIVSNELDAAANFNLQTRTQNAEHRQLTLIRLGTSGGLQPDLAVGSIVCASHGLGIDGVLNFYRGNNAVCEDDIAMAFAKFTNWPHRMAFPYCVAADNALAQHFGSACEVGITVTAPGF